MYKGEEASTAIIEGETEGARNHNEVKINVREPIKNNLAINAEIRSDLATSNNIQQRIKFATNAQNVDTTPDFAIPGDAIPGWELLHPDDTSINAVSFQGRQADQITARGHLIRVRGGNNNLILIADIWSPTSFINNKTATTMQNTVKQARRIQLGQNDEAIRMMCYNGYKIPSFGRISLQLNHFGRR